MEIVSIAKKAVKYLPFRKKPNEYKERQHEIIELNQRLGQFGIQFSNLIEQSPKCPDAAKVLFRISKSLAENEEWLHILLTEGNLPVQSLAAGNVDVEFSPETLKGHQQYVATMALILSGPYPCLKQYISSVG